MTLTALVLPSWTYDFGEYTGTALGAQAAVAIDTKIASARSAAVTMIATGNYGVAGAWGAATAGTYRVIVRSDAASPQGFQVEVRQVTT